MSDTLKKYDKREFIKLLGLGIGGVSFLSCYDSKNPYVVKKSTEQDTILKQDIIAVKPKIENITQNDVFYLERNDEKYESYRKTYNKRFNLFPKVIAVCFTTKGVQDAILKANERNIKVAVKSGGHSFEAFSSNENGMVINLANMNNIQWLDGESVLLEPACFLKEIYADFLPKGRILPAGSCGTVGIGGLALGGGYGFFSRKYGLTCDHLESVKMVDATGNIVDSDSDKNLLWAMKGGGNGNFGIVTEMRFKTRIAPKNFSSYRLKFRNLTVDRFLQIVPIWFKITSEFPQEAFSAFVLNGKTLTILITNYTNHTKKFESSFLELRNLADNYKPTYNQNLAPALKRYYGIETPLYFKNASAGLFNGYDDLSDAFSAIFEKITTYRGLIFQMNTMGGEINNPKFIEESAYPHRNSNYLGELQAYWEQPSQEQRLVKGFAEVQAIIKSTGITKHYRNYPDVNFENWETSYYGENYSKLQKLKNKYDPDDLFHYEQSVRNS